MSGSIVDPLFKLSGRPWTTEWPAKQASKSCDFLTRHPRQAAHQCASALASALWPQTLCFCGQPSGYCDERHRKGAALDFQVPNRLRPRCLQVRILVDFKTPFLHESLHTVGELMLRGSQNALEAQLCAAIAEQF